MRGNDGETLMEGKSIRLHLLIDECNYIEVEVYVIYSTKAAQRLRCTKAQFHSRLHSYFCVKYTTSS